MNRDKIRARASELQIQIKRAEEELAGGLGRRGAGVATELTDKVRKTVGRLKRTVGEAIEHANHAIKR